MRPCFSRQRVARRHKPWSERSARHVTLRLFLARSVLALFGLAAHAVSSAQAQTTTARTTVNAGSRVVLVRPAPGHADLAEAPTRIHAELTAAGFDVEVVDPDPTLTPQEQLVAIEARSTNAEPAVATIVLARASSGMAADIWILDRVTAKTSVRRIDIPANDRAAAILAVRTVELLRASLLETVTTTPPADAHPLPVPTDVREWMQPPALAVSLDLGVNTVFSAENIGPLFGPLLRAAVGNDTFAGRVAFTAPVLGAALTASEGSAQVYPFFFEGEGVITPVHSSVGKLYGALGLGVYYVQVQGSGTSPATGHSSGQAGGSLKVGLGGQLNLTPHLGVFFEPQVLVMWPAVAVNIAGVEAGRIGHPALGANLGLAWTL